MNIFFLSLDVEESASWLIDRHVNKMIVESSQMLANCYDKDILSREDCPKKKNGEPHRHTFLNHPCCKWAMKSRANFNWLLDYALAMFNERVFRTGNGHFSVGFLHWCKENPPQIQDLGMTAIPQCFGKFSDLVVDSVKPSDIINSHRTYYSASKKFDKAGHRMDRWTKRERPWWWKNE
jgi:hypothetical protein